MIFWIYCAPEWTTIQEGGWHVVLVLTHLLHIIYVYSTYIEYHTLMWILERCCETLQCVSNCQSPSRHIANTLQHDQRCIVPGTGSEDVLHSHNQQTCLANDLYWVLGKRGWGRWGRKWLLMKCYVCRCSHGLCMMYIQNSEYDNYG